MIKFLRRATDVITIIIQRRVTHLSAFEMFISKAQAICLIYDHSLAPGKLASNCLKFCQFLGSFLNIALFIKKSVLSTKL